MAAAKNGVQIRLIVEGHSYKKSVTSLKYNIKKYIYFLI